MGSPINISRINRNPAPGPACLVGDSRSGRYERHTRAGSLWGRRWSPGPGAAPLVPAGGQELGGHWLARGRRRGGERRRRGLFAPTGCRWSCPAPARGKAPGKRSSSPWPARAGNSAPRMQFVSTRPQPQQLGIQGLGLDSGSWSWAQALPPEEVCHQEPALRGEMAEGMPPMQVGAPPPAPWPPACRGGGAGRRAVGAGRLGARAARGGDGGRVGRGAGGSRDRPGPAPSQAPPAPRSGGRPKPRAGRAQSRRPGRPREAGGPERAVPGPWRGRNRVTHPGPGLPRGLPAALAPGRRRGRAAYLVRSHCGHSDEKMF